MSDNRSRHDRLAVRLSLIISRLMAGESLSLKTLSDEFGVTERTLQRDFHQRLVHLDLEYRNGRYSLRRQSSPGAIPEMLSFIQNTGIARILPLRNGRLITCLTDNQEPSPCLIWLPAPDTAHITETDNAWLYSLSHQTNDTGESEWIHFTGSGYLLRTDAWSYPVLRLKRLGLSKTFRRLVVTLIRRYGVSLIHLDASAECLPDLPTFDW